MTQDPYRTSADHEAQGTATVERPREPKGKTAIEAQGATTVGKGVE